MEFCNKDSELYPRSLVRHPNEITNTLYAYLRDKFSIDLQWHEPTATVQLFKA